MPGPPSMGVFKITIDTTKVMAKVIKANNSPRKRLTRNTTAPKATPNKAATKAATGKLARKDQSAWPHNTAVV